jgi:hypothetical protein
MVRDLMPILEGWDYEPGKISVRKILGQSGREKIQTRIDLGVLQLELDGRPDGARPYGHESLLEYYEQTLIEHVQRRGDDESFSLSRECCRVLRQEAYLFYQRYLSLFVLEDYDRVAADTARNLRLMDFCRRYAEHEEDRAAMEEQRPYVVMMYTRSRAHRALRKGEPEKALRAVEGGLRRVADLLRALELEEDERVDDRSEIRLLDELREKVLNDLPPTAPARLEAELERALSDEDYERAAEIRDQLERER